MASILRSAKLANFPLRLMSGNIYSTVVTVRSLLAPVGCTIQYVCTVLYVLSRRLNRGAWPMIWSVSLLALLWKEWITELDQRAIVC